VGPKETKRELQREGEEGSFLLFKKFRIAKRANIHANFWRAGQGEGMELNSGGIRRDNVVSSRRAPLKGKRVTWLRTYLSAAVLDPAVHTKMGNNWYSAREGLSSSKKEGTDNDLRLERKIGQKFGKNEKKRDESQGEPATFWLNCLKK